MIQRLLGREDVADYPHDREKESEEHGSWEDGWQERLERDYEDFGLDEVRKHDQDKTDW